MKKSLFRNDLVKKSRKRNDSVKKSKKKKGWKKNDHHRKKNDLVKKSFPKKRLNEKYWKKKNGHQPKNEWPPSLKSDPNYQQKNKINIFILGIESRPCKVSKQLSSQAPQRPHESWRSSICNVQFHEQILFIGWLGLKVYQVYWVCVSFLFAFLLSSLNIYTALWYTGIFHSRSWRGKVLHKRRRTYEQSLLNSLQSSKFGLSSFTRSRRIALRIDLWANKETESTPERQ